MTWRRIDHADRGPEFVFHDEQGQETMRAFFGGGCYAHFCNLEEHIERLQQLAAAMREWDQAEYTRQTRERLHLSVIRPES